MPIGPALELEMVDDWVMALGEIELLVGFLDALVVVFLVNWRFLSSSSAASARKKSVVNNKGSAGRCSIKEANRD